MPSDHKLLSAHLLAEPVREQSVMDHGGLVLVESVAQVAPGSALEENVGVAAEEGVGVAVEETVGVAAVVEGTVGVAADVEKTVGMASAVEEKEGVAVVVVEESVGVAVVVVEESVGVAVVVVVDESVGVAAAGAVASLAEIKASLETQAVDLADLVRISDLPRVARGPSAH